MKKILFWLDLTFDDGRIESHPGPRLPPDADRRELEQKYLALSQRGAAFPHLQKATIRPATEQEIAEMNARKKLNPVIVEGP